MEIEVKVRAKRIGAAGRISQIHIGNTDTQKSVQHCSAGHWLPNLLLGLKPGFGEREAEARQAAVTGSLIWTAAGSLMGIRAMDQKARKS